MHVGLKLRESGTDIYTIRNYIMSMYLKITMHHHRTVDEVCLQVERATLIENILYISIAISEQLGEN